MNGSRPAYRNRAISAIAGLLLGDTATNLKGSPADTVWVLAGARRFGYVVLSGTSSGSGSLRRQDGGSRPQSQRLAMRAEASDVGKVCERFACVHAEPLVSGNASESMIQVLNGAFLRSRSCFLRLRSRIAFLADARSSTETAERTSGQTILCCPKRAVRNFCSRPSLRRISPFVAVFRTAWACSLCGYFLPGAELIWDESPHTSGKISSSHYM